MGFSGIQHVFPPRLIGDATGPAAQAEKSFSSEMSPADHSYLRGLTCIYGTPCVAAVFWRTPVAGIEDLR